ncbi:MAG: hypothetical protein Q7S40_33365 [Opitutaceae bacterium]|nr:hypothetical protein [Opitutaceae bacterium]
MSKFAVGLGLTAAVVAGGAAFYVQRADNAKLHREIALLRAEVQMSAAAARREATKPTAVAPAASDAVVVAEHAQPPAGELTGLREEIVALRKSMEGVSRLAQAAQAKNTLEAKSVAETELIPVTALKNAGTATPEATAQTLMWAASAGEVDTLAATLVFPPAARAKADAWFATLSDNTRQQYGSPEKLIALMVAKEGAKLGGIQVLGQTPIAPDVMGVRMRFSDVEGNTKDDNFVMHRSDTGWKLVLPEATVEKFGRQIAGKR